MFFSHRISIEDSVDNGLVNFQPEKKIVLDWNVFLKFTSFISAR